MRRETEVNECEERLSFQVQREMTTTSTSTTTRRAQRILEKICGAAQWSMQCQRSKYWPEQLAL